LSIDHGQKALEDSGENSVLSKLIGWWILSLTFPGFAKHLVGGRGEPQNPWYTPLNRTY